MSNLEEKVNNKVEVADTALEGVDTLWSKHPRKIILAVFIFLVWGAWQIRHEFLEYAQKVQQIRHEEMRHSDSTHEDYVEYLITEQGDTIGDVLNTDTLYYEQ